MKIFGRLMFAFGALAIICAVIGGIGWYSLRVTNKQLAEITDVNLPAVEALGQVLEAQNAIRSSERTLFISTLDMASRQQQLANLKTQWHAAEGAIARYNALPRSEHEEALWGEGQQAWGEWKKEHDRLVSLVALVKDDGIQILETTLSRFWLDHIKWASGLERAVSNGRPFSGEIDPSRCELGQWLNNFKAKNPDLSEALDDLRESHAELHKYGTTINGLMLAGKLGEARDVFHTKVELTVEIIEDIFDYALTIVESDINLMKGASEVALGSADKAFSRTSVLLENLAVANKTRADQSRAEAALIVSRGQLFSAAAVILGAVLAITFGFFTARNISLPMVQAVDTLQQMERGDLDARLKIDRRDEIGRMTLALNTMIESLSQVVRSIKKTAANMNLTAGELDKSNKALAGGTQIQNQEIASGTQVVSDFDTIVRQVKGKVTDLSEALLSSSTSAIEMSQAIHDTSGMAEGMASAVDRISSSLIETNANIVEIVTLLDALAGSSAEVSGAAEQLADSSGQVMATAEESTDLANTVTGLASSKATAALNEVARVTLENQQLVADYRRLIYSLGNRSAGIGKIIEVIRDISEQTNLLSLNAAIIAAQSGEHGRGFAVVANEIRNFSETTSTSAHEIDEVIKVVREEVAEAVALIEKVQSGADSSIASVSEASEVLKEVVECSSRSVEMSRDICKAATQQVEGSNGIYRVATRNAQQVVQIKRMMEEQKLGSDHIVTSVEQLREISSRLRISTQEQAEASTTVSRALSEMQEFSTNVGQAMTEQEDAASKMVESLGRISRVTETNLGVMGELGDVVLRLGALSDRLIPEVARFRFSAEVQQEVNKG